VAVTPAVGTAEVCPTGVSFTGAVFVVAGALVGSIPVEASGATCGAAGGLAGAEFATVSAEAGAEVLAVVLVPWVTPGSLLR